MGIKKVAMFCGFALVTAGLAAQGVDGVSGASAVQQRSVKAKGEAVVFKGTETHTCGKLPKVGKAAPDFAATDADLQDVSLYDYKGKKIILNIFPSIDTPTCAASVRQFNAEASSLDNTVVLCLSMDLPFAQKRFCAAEGLERVKTLSLFRSPDFAKGYGLQLADGPMQGLTARAVIVIDEKGIVRYTELVGNIAQEPDYKAALDALGKI